MTAPDVVPARRLQFLTPHPALRATFSLWEKGSRHVIHERWQFADRGQLHIAIVPDRRLGRLVGPDQRVGDQRAPGAGLQRRQDVGPHRVAGHQALLGAGALEALDEPTITRALYTREMPDPDLVIRTSGEQRISNFLLWQIAYSEILVTDRLWPDFRGLHLLEAIADYQRRERRFGGLGESFTDEDLNNLEPAEQVAEEIKDHLTPQAETKPTPALSRR